MLRLWSERNAADVLRDREGTVRYLEHFLDFLQSTCPKDIDNDVRETVKHIHIRCCKSSRNSSQLRIAAEIESVMDHFIDLESQN